MQDLLDIPPPASEDDTDGAVRVFQEFLENYYSALSGAERYFDQMMGQVEPQFARAYVPWQKAVKDLMQGVYLVARKVPLRNTRALADALRLFTLDSAINMLQDICISCKMKLGTDWAEKFKNNMQALGVAFRVLMQQQVISRVR